jgi:hypothetical protein
MLDVKNMHLKDTAIQVNSEGQNMQSILQFLMENAVKQCQCFSTDFLIFYENSFKKFLDGGIKEIDLYFCQMNISWQDNTGYTCGQIPKNYRYAIKLVRENERTYSTEPLFDIKCYYTIGNV